MESSVTPYRSLNIFYPKKDNSYKELEELIKRPDISKLLQDNYINVFTLMRDDINKLIVHLNDFSMMPIATFSELTEKTIKDIIEICGGLSQPQTNQTNNTTQEKQAIGGGKIDYKYKYEKYKTKYSTVKDVITKLY